MLKFLPWKFFSRGKEVCPGTLIKQEISSIVMKVKRAWKYRVYPSRVQEKVLISYLHNCKKLWNSLLEYSKKYYEETKKFPSKAQLCQFSKKAGVFSQVAQNVADRLVKSLRGVVTRKKAGRKVGFPRFKSIDRMKSFTYPQFGFKLSDSLELSGVGRIAIKKHREIKGKVKTLTLKKSASGRWYAIFTTETEIEKPEEKQGLKTGIDLGIEHFAYFSDGTVIENPKHLRHAEERLKETQRRLSNKKKGSKNRRKARFRVAIAHEKLANRRRDFLHKISRNLVMNYSFIAMENLNVAGLAEGFLAKSVLDCSWAEFTSMLRYKAAEAGCEVVFVNPAHTSQRCSCCGLVQKKSLAERWHRCLCGASMHRDLNAAINILTRAIANSQERVRQSESTGDSATSGQGGSNAWGEDRNSILEEPRSPASPRGDLERSESL